MNKENYCNLYIVRHGETEFNVKDIMQGHAESILTEKGVSQATETANELKDVKFDAIFSSDSIRTQKTAEIIKLNRDIVIQTSNVLRERTFGSFEGKNGSEYREALKEKLNKLKELESSSEEESWNFELAGDIETDEAIFSRFVTKLREIAVAYPNKTVLVVGHGGPIRMFLIKLGYAKKKELPGGSFKNAGFVNVLSDGVDFFLKKVKGVELVK